MPESVNRTWTNITVEESTLTNFACVVDRLYKNPSINNHDQTAVFKFDEDAQGLYIELYNKITQQEASSYNPPVIRAHLGKMNKTIATLALLFELIEGNGQDMLITGKSMQLACNWFDYLMSHAEAIYSVTYSPELEGAKLILARKNKLPEVFTARDIIRKHWAGL